MMSESMADREAHLHVDELVDQDNPPLHAFNGDPLGHNCLDCSPDSIWKCDKDAHLTGPAGAILAQIQADDPDQPTVISELEPFISTNTVADMFEVTNETVRNWILAGRIKAFKVGQTYRLRKKDVIDFANQHYGE